jgi:O-antigen ligase
MALSFLLGKIKKKNILVVMLFLSFWIFYFMRLFVSINIIGEPLAKPPYTYWMWAIGAAFLPSLSVLFLYNPNWNDRLAVKLLVFSGFASFLFLNLGTTEFVNDQGHAYDSGRLRAESLNPIAMGHAGATAVLLSLHVFLAGNQSVRRITIAAFVAIGGFLLVLQANSRGPIIALSVCLALVYMSATNYKLRSLVVGLALFAVVYILFSNTLNELPVVDRFQNNELTSDISILGRIMMFQGALEQFIGSPLIGSSVEERTMQYYPHNVILEAFMATGVLGGVPFLLLTLLGLRASWSLIRQKKDMWVGLLAIQYIVGGQFSGAIYSSTAMWVTVILAILNYQSLRSPR